MLMLGTVVSGCSREPEAKSESKPNVLFIICDDLNDYNSDLGGHPDIKTPNIENFAKTATSFSNAHTNVGLSQPSRNSLFTGIYPHTSKDFGWTPQYKNSVLQDTRTFLELFREEGYHILGSGKLLHKDVDSLWDEWGVTRRINYGPHAYNGEKSVGHPSVPEPFRSINIVDGSFAPLSDIPEFPDDETGSNPPGWTYGPYPFRYVNDDERDLMPDEMHANWAIEKISEMEQNDNGKPFFLGVGFVNPHTPLYAPQKYFDMFPLDEIELPKIKEGDLDDSYYRSVFPPEDVGLHYYDALKKAYGDEEKGLKLFMQAYLACVAFVDEQIGKVIEAVENSKFSNNTIIILTSDHGWQMGEKEYLYKNSPWEESTRIPLIIKDPRISEKQQTVHHPVSLIDIYPTLTDLCGLEGETKRTDDAPGIEGFSLKPFLEDPGSADWKGPEGALTLIGSGINKPVEGLGFISNPSAKWHVELTRLPEDEYIMKQNYSYRTKDWRYIMYNNGKEELYDHRIDPYEWNNLAGDENYADVMEDLKNQVMDIIEK